MHLVGQLSGELLRLLLRWLAAAMADDSPVTSAVPMNAAATAPVIPARRRKFRRLVDNGSLSWDGPWPARLLRIGCLLRNGSDTQRRRRVRRRVNRTPQKTRLGIVCDIQ